MNTGQGLYEFNDDVNDESGNLSSGVNENIEPTKGIETFNTYYNYFSY